MGVLVEGCKYNPNPGHATEWSVASRFAGQRLSIFASWTGRLKHSNRDGPEERSNGGGAAGVQAPLPFVLADEFEADVLAAWRGFHRLHIALDFGREFVLGNFQVVAGLQIHPENGRVPEVAGQP